MVALGGFSGFGGGGSGEMRMDYEQVEAMIASLKNAAQKLRDIEHASAGMAKTIDNGALIGTAGQAFSEGITSKLNAAIERLALKLEERATYVANEEAQLKSAISNSAGEY